MFIYTYIPIESPFQSETIIQSGYSSGKHNWLLLITNFRETNVWSSLLWEGRIFPQSGIVLFGNGVEP